MMDEEGRCSRKPRKLADGMTTAPQDAGIERPFLLPRVNARRRKLLDLLSSVGDLGLMLPEDCWL